ncbi:class D sortase [Anaerobacillus sp. MEB173]|uniref:class D sortase n=1 Tax=Anaerobacillus sp. MEB173 TaxID=3383345 RepID=UPI003F92CC9B
MKKCSLLFIAILLFCLGVYVVIGNTIKFQKGFIMASASSSETPSPTENELGDKASIKESLSSETQALYSETPKIGENIGELYIPKLDSALPIIHGTSEDELEKGVGHFAGSVLPGHDDNSVLAGHRDTVFRKLGEVGVNDELIVKTSAGTFTYKVRKVRIVDSDDRTVIVSMPKATLTVSTCYPFTFIGPAPQRYVLVADLVSVE